MDTVAAAEEEAGEGVEGTGTAAVRGGAEEGAREDRAPTWTRTEVDGILHT